MDKLINQSLWTIVFKLKCKRVKKSATEVRISKITNYPKDEFESQTKALLLLLLLLLQRLKIYGFTHTLGVRKERKFEFSSRKTCLAAYKITLLISI
jgi:hypothetical protein